MNFNYYKDKLIELIELINNKNIGYFEVDKYRNNKEAQIILFINQFLNDSELTDIDKFRLLYTTENSHLVFMEIIKKDYSNESKRYLQFLLNLSKILVDNKIVHFIEYLLKTSADNKHLGLYCADSNLTNFQINNYYWEMLTTIIDHFNQNQANDLLFTETKDGYNLGYFSVIRGDIARYFGLLTSLLTKNKISIDEVHSLLKNTIKKYSRSIANMLGTCKYQEHHQSFLDFLIALRNCGLNNNRIKELLARLDDKEISYLNSIKNNNLSKEVLFKLISSGILSQEDYHYFIDNKSIKDHLFNHLFSIKDHIEQKKWLNNAKLSDSLLGKILHDNNYLNKTKEEKINNEILRIANLELDLQENYKKTIEIPNFYYQRSNIVTINPLVNASNSVIMADQFTKLTLNESNPQNPLENETSFNNLTRLLPTPNAPLPSDFYRTNNNISFFDEKDKLKPADKQELQTENKSQLTNHN